jgi:hypothetical protein
MILRSPSGFLKVFKNLKQIQVLKIGTTETTFKFCRSTKLSFSLIEEKSVF